MPRFQAGPSTGAAARRDGGSRQIATTSTLTKELASTAHQRGSTGKRFVRLNAPSTAANAAAAQPSSATSLRSASRARMSGFSRPA